MRGLRGLLRRRARRRRAPARRRGCSRSTPRRLDEVLADVVVLGEATGARRGGRAAAGGAARAARRGRATAVAGAPGRGSRRSSGSTRRIAGGHWVPEMIELAGGAGRARRARRALARARAGRRSPAARPDVVVGDAVRAVRRRGARPGARPREPSCDATGAAERDRASTPPPRSRVRGHGSSTGSSCSATSSTPTLVRAPGGDGLAARFGESTASEQSRRAVARTAPPKPASRRSPTTRASPTGRAPCGRSRSSSETPTGSARTVSSSVDAKVRRIALHARVLLRAARAGSSGSSSRAAASTTSRASYRFEPIEDGARTIATYALGIDPASGCPA